MASIGLKTADAIGKNLVLRGLDLVNPPDMMQEGSTPSAHDFRLYAKQENDRKVAVSSRFGPGEYVSPLGETLDTQNVSTTGAATASVGTLAGQHLWLVTPGASGALTKIDIKMSDVGGGKVPLMVTVYQNNTGIVGNVLAESSIVSEDVSGTATYCSAQFITPYIATSGVSFWVGTIIQDDGADTDTYTLSTATATPHAYKTDSTLTQIVQQSYAVNYKTYITPVSHDKGQYRFNKENGVNVTMAPYGTTMYTIDETNHVLTPLITGLSSSATEYSFTDGDGKVFWVNGYDLMTAWNGTYEATNTNIVTNGGFTTDTTGWAATGGGTGNAIARYTSDFHTTPASLNITATSGTRSARYATAGMLLNHRYKISFWAKGASASGNIQFCFNTTPVAATVTAITAAWAQYSFYYTATADSTSFDIQSTAVNFLLDDVSLVDTGIEYIIDPELPILSEILMHKDRIWGKTAADNNKLVFCEAPGNPSNVASTLQWYHAWLSLSFIYTPRPFNGSPVTRMASFQDSLHVWTQDNHYVISGYDRGTFSERQATGHKGCISQRGLVVDNNSVFFVSDNGNYEFNGSSDKKISGPVDPLFDACANKYMITPVVWKNQVRFYMASSGSSVNDSCLIYDKETGDWMYDTRTGVSRAIYYNDANDNGELIEVSSYVPALYKAEQNAHSLGAPIDFEYDLKYESNGYPAQKKRIKRYFPLFQGVESTFKIDVGMDKDFQDAPLFKKLLLLTNGATWDNFYWDDGTRYGGDTTFKMYRMSFGGNAYYWQLRVKRKGVNNRVAFMGSEYKYRIKKV